MAARHALLLLVVATTAMLTAVAANESAKLQNNAADKMVDASSRSAVGGDRLVKATARSVGGDFGTNSASSVALESLSSKAETPESHLVKVTSGADVPLQTASRMDTEVAPPSTAVRAADAAKVTDEDSGNLASTASSRVLDAASVDTIIRRVTANSNRDAVIKVTRRLANAIFRGRELVLQYHVVMIRNTLWHNAKFNDVIYTDVWTFRGTPFKIFIFRSGTLFHTPASLDSFGYNSIKSKQTFGKVEFFRLF